MIKQMTSIDLHWPTQEPFLFCAHHLDHYPQGNQHQELDAKYFSGRPMGADFEEKNGFRLYHGRAVPGFPVHPHRGFETITIVRRGFADHADSLGAAGRFGEGDVQWMNAGSGVQHSEMFPLLNQDQDNTLELFQIWLNLPGKSKMAPPVFKMLWSEDIPLIKNEKSEVVLICGEFSGEHFYHAPSNSWAADPANGVNIFLVKIAAGGEFRIPAKDGVNRSLYLFNNGGAAINGLSVVGKQAVFVEAAKDLLVSSTAETEFLFLEAKPIGEPVAQRGPFVMNTQQEIFDAINDYQQTQFGGWPWEREDMIHGPEIVRFAKYPDGRIERPG